VGCPIRKSADQSFFAAPHGLSQRSTSFIASQRQGIHRMPLRHLIVLIINTHPGIDFIPGSTTRSATLLDYRLLTTDSWNRKTSLLRDHTDGACGQANASKTPPPHERVRHRQVVTLADHDPANERQRRLEYANCIQQHTANDDWQCRRMQIRYDLLFTMSDNTRPPLTRRQTRNCYFRTSRSQGSVIRSAIKCVLDYSSLITVI
jgi:hypothetical protein